MRKRCIVGAFALAMFGASIAHAGKKVETSVFHGKSKEEAGKALLDIALRQAGDGSWERIGVGRVLYLAGSRSEGQALFDAVLARKPAASDLMRIGRVYMEAGEWVKAKPLFDRYVRENPRDEKEMAEIGAYYLIHDDRTTADTLFARSFQVTDAFWATLAAAAAYHGVAPQP